MRNVIPTWGTTFAYKAGVEARDLGKDKTPPGGIGRQRRSWWLAGWNDRDIELQVLAEKKRAYGAGLVNHTVSTMSLDMHTNTRSDP